MFEAGAGKIGNYDNCSFNTEGFFTFKGNENSNPVIGEKEKLHTGNEIKIEVVFEKHLQSKILKALFNTHIYEEVAYEIYDLKNSHQNIGLGMIGEFETKTNDYLLLTSGIGTDIQLKKSTFNLFLTASNLLNKQYLAHLSRLKTDGINNMGRNIVLGVNFNL